MLRKLTIKHKVYSLAILGAVLALLIAGGAMYSINAVGVQLKQIAEEDIPLTTAVTEITVHQLEQAIFFERAIRYAEIMEGNPSAQKHYHAAKKYFLKMAHQVDEEILAAEEQVAHIIKYEVDHGGGQHIIDEFKHVEEILKKVEKEHKSFDDHVVDVFNLFEAGRINDAEHLAEKVEAEADKLDHELEALLVELETFTEESAKHAEHLEQKLLKILAISSMVFTILFLIIATFIVRGIVRPLLATKDYADELSKGNLDVAQPTHNFEDEIADMMSSLSVFKENAVEANQLREHQKEQEIRAEQQQKQAMQDLANDFDTQVGGMIGSLAAAATELESTAESMKRIADETQQSSKVVASSSDKSSTNVNTVAAAMEEMATASSEIATQVTAANTKSNQTANDAQNANDTVGELNSLVENIGEVVVAIQDIAEQTNLLALNATIEAARAGEAGKGFAVVADEVKKLANETGQKTEEISSKISDIQAATRASVDAMQRIISNISEINASVTGVSAAVEEQNATTAEITRGVSEASQGAQQVSQIIGEVQSGAEETGSSAEAVLVAAQEVAQLSENLKGSVDGFLERVRGDSEPEQNAVNAEQDGQTEEEVAVAAE